MVTGVRALRWNGAAKSGGRGSDGIAPLVPLRSVSVIGWHMVLIRRVASQIRGVRAGTHVLVEDPDSLGDPGRM